MENMDGFPSGQRGQTVNLLQNASVVRIHLHPFMYPLVSGIQMLWILNSKRQSHNPLHIICWYGGIGRHKRLKISRGQLRAGSSPATSIAFL